MPKSNNYVEFLTLEEQINYLESIGLIIENKEFALNLLKTVPYYDLINGYSNFFMKNEKFKKGITLLYLFEFYIFDKNIQTILFKYSLNVENFFKTQLSYLISEKIGVEVSQYTDPTNYVKITYDKKRKEKLFTTLNAIRFQAQNNTDNPTKYYRDNFENTPSWILFKNVNFNIVFNLFTFLKKEDKNEIIKNYFDTELMAENKNIELFKTTLTIVRKFRNKIAHNLKAISYRCDKEIEHSEILKILDEKELINENDNKLCIGINDLYSMFLSEILLLNHSHFKAMLLYEMRFLFKSNPDITLDYFKIANFPLDTLERIEKVLERKIIDQ